MTRLGILPMRLSDANTFVSYYHRHHKPAHSHKFSIGCIDEKGIIHGVCIVGRPVARMINQNIVLEVTRLCTDGTPNACSFLYSAAARIGKAMGYAKIQTYILDSETGSSLKAANWEFSKQIKGHKWDHKENGGRKNDHPLCDKQRWELCLNPTFERLGAYEP